MADQNKSVLRQIIEWPSRNSEQTLGGQLAAMGREMVKDLRSTVHQVFFGRPEGMSEPGAPLSPTPQIVTEHLTGKLSLDDLRGYARDRANEADKRMERGHERGHEM